MEHYNVKINAFEGPLDLLLHLINRLEIDIYDIPVAEITEQYLIYIHTMQELELDIASEYLVMAATLLAIKSQMLLPKHEEDNYDEDIDMEMEEDPRDELVERLIEYRRFKEAAEDLKELEQERSLLYTKAPSDLSDMAKEVKMEQTQVDVSLYDMLGALQKLLRRKKWKEPLATKVARQEIPIEKRIDEVIRTLRKSNGRKNFNDLFTAHSREEVVVTFLAVLELMKRQAVLVTQDNNFAELYVEVAEGK
ncbi:segregation/condensation protein A [Cytobacillus sp. FSL W7-1323]|uniref:Segregation and condensation protein A n=1 Tax=Cytobacillus kochii TaxID=859143 RepID=A0A248TLQ2_9BACI|nr:MULTISPECIES: segregation/condensation protein A [Cytobacillus]ASV69143.1 segregation/condensation protein A [Cytobacillus kochii]MDQ0183864.1 segregation and condensation protein A [Cytobacillus kochii]MEA1852946.1 segregation/condensation protein A [Cytobacillus sp. OWB-43]MED1604180.1 segregation/condensation protein A [Cytobacillus kochii]